MGRITVESKHFAGAGVSRHRTAGLTVGVDHDGQNDASKVEFHPFSDATNEVDDRPVGKPGTASYRSVWSTFDADSSRPLGFGPLRRLLRDLFPKQRRNFIAGLRAVPASRRAYFWRYLGALDHDQLVSLARNHDRAVRRARGAIRDCCLGIGVNRIMTLTFRDNVTDYEDAVLAWGRFASWFLETFGHSMIAVPERQSRGAWHFHCGIRRLPKFSKAQLREMDRVWARGKVHVTSPWKIRRSAQMGEAAPSDVGGGSHAAANYFGKYLSKEFSLLDFLANPGRHRYRSRGDTGVTQTTVELDMADADSVKDCLLSFARDYHCIAHGVHFRSDGTFVFWHLTTERPPPVMSAEHTFARRLALDSGLILGHWSAS